MQLWKVSSFVYVKKSIHFFFGKTEQQFCNVDELMRHSSCITKYLNTHWKRNPCEAIHFLFNLIFLLIYCIVLLVLIISYKYKCECTGKIEQSTKDECREVYAIWIKIVGFLYTLSRTSTCAFTLCYVKDKNLTYYSMLSRLMKYWRRRT